MEVSSPPLRVRVGFDGVDLVAADDDHPQPPLAEFLGRPRRASFVIVGAALLGAVSFGANDGSQFDGFVENDVGKNVDGLEDTGVVGVARRPDVDKVADLDLRRDPHLVANLGSRISVLSDRKSRSGRRNRR